MKSSPVWTTASVLLVAAAALACGGAGRKVTAVPVSGVAGVQIASPAFVEGSPIPVKYACDGDDLSPPLSWNSVPGGSQSVALKSTTLMRLAAPGCSTLSLETRTVSLRSSKAQA